MSNKYTVYENPADVCVTKFPTYLEDGTPTGQYALVNQNMEPLPVQSVAQTYQVINYGELMHKIVNPMFDQGWNVQQCKAYKNGAQAVWALEHPDLDLPEGLKGKHGTDRMTWNLLMRAGHGGSSVRVDVYAGRLICTNGMMTKMLGSQSEFRVQHRKNASLYVSAIGNLMVNFKETVERWTERAEVMVGKRFTNEEIQELYEKFYPLPEKKPGRVEGVRRSMRLVRLQEAEELGMDPDSAWLVMNSLTYAQQHLGTSKREQLERFSWGNLGTQSMNTFEEVEALV
jgi:hypothetical protein